jgi:hypothetical protein
MRRFESSRPSQHISDWYYIHFFIKGESFRRELARFLSVAHNQFTAETVRRVISATAGAKISLAQFCGLLFRALIG